MEKEHCKGCLLHDEYDLCVVIPTFDNEECPCLTCLIKMICQKMCLPFQLYRGKCGKYRGKI